MVLLAAGRSGEAQRLLDAGPALPHSDALDCVANVLAEPTQSALLDSFAYPAFGIAPSDPVAIRYLMRELHDYPNLVRQLSVRLRGAAPGE
jgi:hypothetical protein